MRVLIQGAGPAGLALALALRGQGWAVTVVDRAAPDRRDGFAVGLHPFGYDAAERLGLVDAIRAQAMPLNRAEYRDSRGRVYLSHDYRRIAEATGGRMVAIMRDRLQDVLIAACARAGPKGGSGIEIRHRTEIIALAEDADGVTVGLSGGGGLRADLVIGADGYRSGLRRLHFGPDAGAVRALGYRVAAWKVAMALPASVVGVADPGRQATLYDIGGGQAATLFCWRDDDAAGLDGVRLDGAARRALLAARFGDLPDPVRRALDLCVDWDDVFLDSVCQIDMPAWHRGRVALLGDAAWCLAFLSGQGTSLALTGAVALADALARDPGPGAFAPWEARLRPAVARLQAMSRRIGGQYVPTSRLGMRLQGVLAPVLFSRPVLPLMLRRMRPPALAEPG